MTDRELFLLREHLLEFSKEAFQYFNGKVNVLNKNVVFKPLLVFFDGTHNNIFGCTKNNIVHIFINNIINCWYFITEDVYNCAILCRNEIIVTIVHELVHCDQLIDGIEYDYNELYAKKIEDECKYKTHNYLLNNYDKINEDLEVAITPELLDLMMSHINEEHNTFNNIDLYWYYNNTLGIICGFEHHILSNELYYYNTFKLNINGKIYVVKDKGKFIYPSVGFVEDLHYLSSLFEYKVNPYYSDEDSIFTLNINNTNTLYNPLISCKIINPLIPTNYIKEDKT